jgi:hemoglobin-like flavoprotein
VTPNQVRLVQHSFATLVPRAEEVAVLFYERLFGFDPALRAMFPADMAGQRRKLMTMFVKAVQALERPQALAPLLAALGRRHAGYGVRDAHYDTLGGALSETLRLSLGEAFDAETEAARAACYSLVATAMREAARGAADHDTAAYVTTDIIVYAFFRGAASAEHERGALSWNVYDWPAEVARVLVPQSVGATELLAVPARHLRQRLPGAIDVAAAARQGRGGATTLGGEDATAWEVRDFVEQCEAQERDTRQPALIRAFGLP